VRIILQISFAVFGRHRCPSFEAPALRSVANHARVSNDRGRQLSRAEDRISGRRETLDVRLGPCFLHFCYYLIKKLN